MNAVRCGYVRRLRQVGQCWRRESRSPAAYPNGDAHKVERPRKVIGCVAADNLRPDSHYRLRGVVVRGVGDPCPIKHPVDIQVDRTAAPNNGDVVTVAIIHSDSARFYRAVVPPRNVTATCQEHLPAGRRAVVVVQHAFVVGGRLDAEIDTEITSPELQISRSGRRHIVASPVERQICPGDRPAV